MRHELKTWSAYYESALSGKKKFDIRKNDREFLLGDTILQKEWDPKKEGYTGREAEYRITYALSGVPEWGLSPNHVILSLEPVYRFGRENPEATKVFELIEKARSQFPYPECDTGKGYHVTKALDAVKDLMNKADPLDTISGIQSAFQYRDHKGSLADAMKTVQTFTAKIYLIEYLQDKVDQFMPGKYNCAHITIEPYGYDRRIRWNTYIVKLGGYGVFGFTDSPVD